MPGPAMHHLIAQKLRSEISQNRGLGTTLTTAQYAQLQALLADPKNLPYLFVGCQGPDFLFFNTKDMPAPIGDLTETYFKVYDVIEDFKKMLLDIVPQPVLDALAAFDEAADEVIEDSVLLSELKQTFEDMQRVVDAFSGTLTEMIKRFISEFNLFEIVSHPYRDGVKKEELWWWFDALHYRKTGKYTKELLNNAPPNSPLHLYAIGYLTHVAADTVGHPYVNTNDGGAYRSHAQRHKTGENYQDVFNMLNAMGVDFNRSKLHTLYNFNFTGTTSDTEPDSNTNMPDDLANMIANAINKIYTENDGDPDPDYGPKISASDVNNAYRLYYKWLKSATDTGTLPPPVPYSFTKELEEIWDKATDNLDSVGDFLENAIDKASGFGILSIFLILAALVAAAVAAALAIIDAVLGALATLGTATIRYAACLVYEHLYNAYQMFRLGVSLNGLAFPMQEHLNEPRFNQFKNTAFLDPTGANAATIFNKMPRLKWDLPSSNAAEAALNMIFHREKHLMYPASTSEKSNVIAAPNSYLDKTSLFYAFGNIPLNKEFIDQIADLATDTSTMNMDQTLLQNLVKNEKNRLGNAITLSEEIYDRWKKGGKIPDFNLDGDRGYAFPCWNHITQNAEDLVDKPSPIVVKNTPSDAVNPPEVKLNFIP